jgi:hypothetical protein
MANSRPKLRHVWLVAVSLNAAPLTVTGIANHQVVTAGTEVAAGSGAPVTLTVHRGKRMVLQTTVAGMRAKLPALPAGGPYRLEFRSGADSAADGYVLDSGDPNM